jgi:ATP-dependent DNA helicase RecG
MLETILTQQESKTLEFKENAESLQNIVKTVVAFANTAGGTIVIGVEDRTKRLIGVEKALDHELRLVNAISDSIAPFLIPNIEIQNYRNKEFIIIKVPQIAGPFYLKSAGRDHGVLVRSGSSNRVADAEMIDALRLFARKVTFDEIPFLEDADVLDIKSIESTFGEVHKSVTKKKLEDLGLLVTNAGRLYPTNGGIILFGANRERAFPDAIVRCARFAGVTKAEIFDHIDITSYPTLAIDEAIRFVEKNTFKGAEIGRMRRKDIPQYPPVAIREAIINAIMHADYSIKGSSIMIAIFDDRIEISNPGGLHFGMTMEDAIGGSSKVRNRVIARVFRELNLIEHWGSGLQRIIKSCEQRGLERPLFHERINEFKVTLYAIKAHHLILEPFQKEIVTYLETKGRIGTKEAAELWKTTPRNALRRLKKLADIGIISKVSLSEKDPYGVYLLTSKGVN